MRRRSNRQAFTLVELLIVLAVSAVVTAAAASMLFATGQAVSARNDVRKAVVRSHVLDVRLRDEIHTSLAFLAAGTGELVLWAEDTNEDGAVNLDEIVLIQHSVGNSELRRYRVDWPDGWTQDQIDAANSAYAPGAVFSTVANGAKGTGYFPSALWSSKVSGWTITLDSGTPQTTRLATMELTMTTEGENHTTFVVASIRSPQAPAAAE